MDKAELTRGFGAMRSMMEEVGATLSALEESVDNMSDEEASPVAHGNTTVAAKLRQMADEMENPDEVLVEERISFEEDGDLIESAFPLGEESGDYILSQDVETATAIRQQVQAEELDRGDEADYARLQGYTEHVRNLRVAAEQPMQGAAGGESLGS